MRGVKMGQTIAMAMGKRAEKYDISLTVHAPYYVNLNSAEPEKVVASKNHIFRAAQVGAWAGAKSVTFHAAYYHDDDPEGFMKKCGKISQKICICSLRTKNRGI